ncbi:MAG: hypothetical protein Fur0012_09600 [Elusimicrobiota bacterium]
MKKNLILALSVFSFACASSPKAPFSSRDIVISRMSDSAFDPKADLSRVAEIACSAFLSSCGDSQALRFVKKSVLKKDRNSEGAQYFYGRHYFDSAAFLKFSGSEKESLKGSVNFYFSFYSTQEKAYDYFTSGLKPGCHDSFCFFFSSSPFSMVKMADSDYQASVEVYSYYIENPINSSVTVLSSATVRIYSSLEEKQVISFDVQESATSFNQPEAAYKSMSACGEAAYKKAVSELSNYAKNLKYTKVIFAGISDLNTLSEIRSALARAGLGSVSPLSFKNREAVFEVYPGGILPEQLAGEIIRRGDLRYNIEYIDKGEIKFSVGENVVNR